MENTKNIINIILYILVIAITIIIGIAIMGYYNSISLYPGKFAESYVTVSSGVFGVLGFIIIASAVLVMVPSCLFFVRYLKNLTDLHRYRKLHELELDKECHINRIHSVRNERLLLQLDSLPPVIESEGDVLDSVELTPAMYNRSSVLSADLEISDSDDEDAIADFLNDPYKGVVNISKKDNNGYRTDLLNELTDAKRILIVGGQGSGKTTLFQHLIKQKLGQGHSTVVMDSHNTPGKWNERVRVVGHGRDYAAIASELENSLELMNHRYEQLGKGEVLEGEFQQVYYFSDEFTTVSKNIDNLSTYLLPLLTEGRKVGINFILAAHSKTASSLGLKGSYDLIQNFEYILNLKNNKGIRFAEVTNSAHPKEIVLYSHPGEYVD